MKKMEFFICFFNYFWIDLQTDKIKIVNTIFFRQSMQQNQAFNGSNSQSNNRQNTENFPKGPPEMARPPINNIFARNIAASQHGSNPPITQNFINNPSSNNLNVPKPPPFTFPSNGPQTSGLLASSNMNIGIKNNISKPFTSPTNTPSFNNFGGGTAQSNILSNNYAQNGNKNTAFFNNSSYSNTASTSFNNINQKPFAPTFTNTLTKTNFNNPNAQSSSFNSMLPNTQTPINFNQTQNFPFPNNNNNVVNSTNPFQKFVSNNPDVTTTAVQNPNPFGNVNNQLNNQPIKQNNSINSVQNAQNIQNIQQFQYNSQINTLNTYSNAKIQQMIENMNINDLKTWDSPYNLFHAQLILNNIFQNRKKQQDQSHLLKGQQEIKVKDSPYKPFIIYMISEIVKNTQNVNQLQQTAIQVNKRADDLEQSLKNRLNTANRNFIKMLKFQRMIKEMQSELNLIESELFNFMKPLLQAYQAKSFIRFEEPDEFSIEIAKNIVMKMQLIQKNMAIIASQSIATYDLIDSLNQRNIAWATMTISQLILYFEKACIRFEILKERYECLQRVKKCKIKENDGQINDSQDEQNEISNKIMAILAESEKKIQSGFFQKQRQST